jgi:hypothetical protein
MTDPGAGLIKGGEECGLVANLQNDVVVGIHFLRDLADVIILAAEEIRVLQRLKIFELALAFVLNVVLMVQGGERPAI